MNYATFNKKVIISVPPNQIMQKCVHRKWPTFIRLVYHPQTQASEGYYINNILKAFEKLNSLDTKLHEYFRYDETYKTPKIIACKGNALSSIEKEAKKISQFLLFVVGLRISRMVLDFIRDSNEQFWLINFKSYELDPTLYRIKEINNAMTNEEILKNYSIRKEIAENSGNIFR